MQTPASSSRRDLLLPVAAGLLIALAGPPVSAQQRLDPEIVRADGRLSDAQSGAVRAYVSAGLEALASAGGVEGAADARRDLVGPLTAIGATPSFVQQYGRALAEGVAGLPADTEPPKRINALLLLRAAPPQEAAPVVRPALQSEEPAIRFTAAKVLVDLLERPQAGAPPLDAGSRRQLQADVTAAAGTETDAYVVGKLLPVLQSVYGDAGQARLIETLAERVAVHVEHPETGFLPELTEMSRLFLTRLGNFQRAEAEGLCRASAGFMKVAAAQLAAGSTPADLRPDAERMLTQSDTILRELAVSQLGLARNAAPDPIADALESDDFAAVADAADAWAAALGFPVVEVPTGAGAGADPGAGAADGEGVAGEGVAGEAGAGETESSETGPGGDEAAAAPE